MASLIKAVTVAALLIVCLLLYPRASPQSISAFVEANSVAAPAVFILLCAVRPMLFFLPSMGLTVVAGALFGALPGTVYVTIGGALSTAVGFYFARWLGRNAMERLVGRNAVLSEIERRSVEKGAATVLSLRLFNLPWDVVSYWAGLSGIRFREFYLASLIPLVPVSFLYTYFGSTIFNPSSPGFVISLLIMAMMGAIPFVRARWKRTA